jgi:ribonuclease Z
MKRRDFLAALTVAQAPLGPLVAEASPAPAPRAAARLTITLLGTGTPAPSLARQGSGYLIEVGSDAIVMDHGPGAHHRLLEAGRTATDVTHAFFTHLHYDHFMDYPRLVLQRWDQGAGKIPELAVYGPAPLARTTELLFGDDGVYGPDLRARTQHQSSLDVFTARGGTLPRRRPMPRVKEIRAGDVIEGNGWKITVGRAAHVQPFLECLALRLDCADGSVCYTGDSGMTDTIVDLARGCDVLIHMNHHFSGTEPSAAYRAACGNHRDNAVVAKRAGVKTLVLTHCLAQIDQPGVREQIVHEIRQTFDGRVIWGEDLMRVTLDQGRIANIESRG